MILTAKSNLLFPLALIFIFAAPQARAATFTVNSTDDAPDALGGDGVCATLNGTCTLRAAIQEANALPGLDTIAFAIGSGAQTIILTSALPTITDPLIIDGTTQPGYTGAPLIELNGSATKGQANGLNITAGSSTVQGLVINRFPANGILLNSAGNVIAGNYIGTDITGTLAMANAKDGIQIDGPNNLIGGTTASARNVISGNLGTGGIVIYHGPASGNVIQGNYIGTDVTGTVPIPNDGRGIAIEGAPNNLIGGTVAGAGNVISGNRASGIRTFVSGAEGNVIQGNFIGTDPTGKVRFRSYKGVQLRTNNNVVGGPGPGAGNLIAGNGEGVALLLDFPSGNLVQGNTITQNGRGVSLYSNAGTGNAILGNSIFANAGLGIDIQPFGAAVPNDACDVDTGPNNLQNFPVLTSAASSPAGTIVMGTLNSTPNSNFTVQFFANPSCDISGNGEGKTYLGQMTVTTDGTCNGGFTANVQRLRPGQVVTSTATDPGGNTSEFSACVVVSGL